MDASAASVTGNRYQANYDVVYLRRDPLRAVVADGMGDGEGSARAGSTTVDGFVRRMEAVNSIGPVEVRTAVADIQREVREIGAEVGRLSGCTLTALLASANGFWLVQLGDSRVYRLRGRVLELLTVDHTSAWLGAVHGWYPFDSPQAAAARYQLIRYVGHPAAPEPDILNVAPAAGDMYLLCTDGVAEQVSYHVIQETLARQPNAEEMVARLVAEANAAGGKDNATAVVVRVLGAGSS